MSDVEQTNLNEEVSFDSELDFSMFTGGEAGYQVLTDEKLKEINKKLPAWNLEPPAKYVKK